MLFSPSERKVITTRRLDSAYKIFVRNNCDFVYYGVQSDIGNDGFRRWVLHGFSIRQGEWLTNTLHLPDTVGSEIDATICFEIIDGYFCTLTSHTSFEADRIEYTSYYDFFRFPLDCPSHEHFERPTKKNLFRRQHSEGPIDDRWTFMKIFTDELSGELKLVESRKEWLSGNSSATRTYYTKTLHVTETGEGARSSHGSDEEEDADQYPEDDRLAQFLGSSTKSNKGHAPERHPTEVHVGDDGSKSVMFTLSKCFIRSYHPASQAFLDLVDDPDESGPYGQQRIRIRAGTRLPRAQSTLHMHYMSSGTENPGHPPQTQRHIDDAHEQSGVVSWPPDCRSSEFDNIQNVLSPPGYTGNVQGTWDHRSLVYATGGGGGANGSVKTLVLVSFDPSIYLKGARSFEESGGATSCKGDLGTRLRDIQDMLAPSHGRGREKEETSISTCLPSVDGEVIVEHRHSASPVGSGLINRRSRSNGLEAQTHPWASFEPAQYLTIGLGLHFAK